MTRNTITTIVLGSALLAGCEEPGGVTRTPQDADSAQAEEPEVPCAEGLDRAVEEVEDGMAGLDASADDAWQDEDPEQTISRAAAEAEAEGCVVEGILGGVYAHEDNLFYGHVYDFEGYVHAEMAGFHMGMEPDWGVFAGYARQSDPDGEGNVGGVYDDDHRFLGRWTTDRDAGVLAGAWRPVNDRGGLFLGVWGDCG